WPTERLLLEHDLVRNQDPLSGSCSRSTGRIMAIDANPRDVRGSLASRLTRGRIVLIVAALVFAALVVTGTLTPVQGLIALVIVAGAALINSSDGSEAVA